MTKLKRNVENEKVHSSFEISLRFSRLINVSHIHTKTVYVINDHISISVIDCRLLAMLINLFLARLISSIKILYWNSKAVHSDRH